VCLGVTRSKWIKDTEPDTRPRADRPASPAAPGDSVRHGCLELPRPWRLLLTAGWNLAESIGLPAAAYLVGVMLGGQAAGMVTATAVVWLTAAVRKVAVRTVPGLLTISALVLTLQTVLVIATGSELVFLLQFPLANLALCVLFARTARSGKPLVADLAAEMVALRRPAAGDPGLDSFFHKATWLWAGIFAASAAGLGALMTVEPAKVFLALTTAVTAGGAVAGTAFCALWFVKVVRRSGLRVRFGQAAGM
jgi:hypothetical protein